MLTNPVFAFTRLGNSVFKQIARGLFGASRLGDFVSGTEEGVLFGDPEKANLYSFMDPQKPLLSIRVSGHWQRQRIFRCVGGSQCVNKYSLYTGMAKAYLVQFQPKFTAAQAAWKTLSPDTQRTLCARASKLGKRMTGRNYFTQLWLLDHHELAEYYP